MKASDLAPNSCGMSNYDVQSLIGEMDVMRSDEYAKLPGSAPRSRFATSLELLVTDNLE